MLSTEGYNKEEILELIALANDFKNGLALQTSQKVFGANLFFEDSTRTKMSFEMAERKLGLEMIPFDVSKSSVNKGESLYDTARTLESIGLQFLVIRHSENKFYEELSGLKIPILNAGDGTGEHPSQTLLDLMTIHQEFGSFEDLKVGIVGDVKHSRVANSLSQTLKKLGAEVFFSGPEEWFVAKDNFKKPDDLVEEADVLVLLRIQHERHTKAATFSKEEYLRNYGLTKDRESAMKQNAIIMHPAPINRGVEIDSDLVECSRSRIFKQMENGVFARMAILKAALEKEGIEFLTK